MAPMKEDSMTEYERKRLDNIRRNQERIASLKIHSTLSEISSAAKRPRGEDSSKTYKSSAAKKKSDPPTSPIVIRRSLRARGLPPDSVGPPNGGSPSSVTDTLMPQKKKFSPRIDESFSFKDAYEGPPMSEREIVSCISSFDADNGCRGHGSKAELFDPANLELDAENVARLVPGRIFTVKFLPRNDLTMVVAGNKFGNVAFWNVDYESEDGNEHEHNGIYLYRPHSAPVSGVVFHHGNSSKIFTSCYDGFLRSVDAEKEIFDLVYRSEHSIYSLSHNQDFANNLYLGEGRGELNVWDHRAGKSSSQYALHESRINTIDFNPQNHNILATSSTDGSACVWDIRNMKADNPESLANVSHKKAVHSATFSPSGSILATTSMDDTVGLTSGANFDEVSMMYHYNQTGRWLTKFRAQWSWDDSWLFIGNMRRGVDVISPEEKTVRMTLKNENMTAIPCRFDTHPFRVGMLASATSGGQVYIWTAK